ncbi:MAG: MFS transporter, partial [Deltaproteobacteria bacterium]|nr:MFS transporter [Deltaproteobacteria bacterium]
GITEAGVFQNILSVFLKPMASDFGWNRATITAAIALGSISGGLISPFVGPKLDRYGPKWLAFCGILILSAGLAAMASIRHVWQLYLFFGLGRLIAVGVLSLVISVSVSNWFIRQRGRAMGIAMLGPRVGTAALPPFVQFMISMYSWRIAWVSMGFLVFLMSAIPSLIFLKRRPEDIGLWPDGKQFSGEKKSPETLSGETTVSPPQDVLEPALSRSEAMHTPVFWILALVSSFQLFAGAGINFNIFPFITDHDVSENWAVLVLTTAAVFGGSGSLVWGFLAERFETKKLLVIEFIFCGIIIYAIYIFVHHAVFEAGAIRTLISLSAVYGLFMGGFMPMLTMSWAEYFGRESLGSIQGAVSPFRWTANATGPLFGSFCFDVFGNYTIPFHAFSLLYIMCGVTCIFLEKTKSPKTA